MEMLLKSRIRLPQHQMHQDLLRTSRKLLEAITAPTASRASQPITAGAQISDNEAGTVVSKEENQRPIKKATGIARYKKSYVTAGPDPDRLPTTGKKRGHSGGDGEEVSSGAGNKRSKKS